MREGGDALTRLENIVLSMVLRFQPVTAYRIRRTFADSIVSNFSTSAGTIYPLIRRLTAKGYLASQAVEGSRRGAELLSCTTRGVEAIRSWVRRIEGEDLVLEDPVRTKMAAMEVLAPAERLAWLRDLRAEFVNQSRTLNDFYHANPDIPFGDELHDNAQSTLAARLSWIERTVKALEGQASDPPVVRRSGSGR